MNDVTAMTPSTDPRSPARRIVSPAGRLLAGAAASLSANLVVAVLGWLGTPPVNGELVLEAVTAAFVVSMAVGVVLFTRPARRWSGAGVIAGAGMGLVLIRPVLTLVFGW